MYFDELENKKSGSWLKHPSHRWMEWKSASYQNKKKVSEWWFRYYDKTIKNPDGTEWANVVIPLSEMPKEFVVVAEKFAIWGWDDSKGTNIWWPEVDDQFNDTFTAISGWNVYWKWKRDALPNDLFIWRNLHVFDPEKPDELFTIKLKNTQSMEWYGTFSKEEAKNAYFWKRVAFGEEKEWHKWSNMWTIPTFKPGGELTDEDKANRKKFSDILREYHAQVDQSSDGEENEAEYKSPTPDELPF